jgi:chromosome segregation ATPase
MSHIIGALTTVGRSKGEEFEYYVDRMFTEIIRRLQEMSELTEKLGVDESTLSEVIPELANTITGLQNSLSAKELVLKEKETTLATDSIELAKVQGELSQVQEIVGKLDPIVEKAKNLVVTPTTTS